MVNFLFQNTPLSFMIQSFWRDEAFSYLLAKKSIGEIIVLTARDFNPPFYYLLLHFWIKIFGSSEIMLRSLSLIFYWGIIYISFLFIERIFKIKNQLRIFLYLFLVMTNPLLIYYAFEARMYTLFAFLSILSCYSLIRKNKKIYIFSTILNFYTHYFAIFIYLFQFFYFLFSFKKKNLLINKKNFWFFIPLLLFLPWIFYIKNFLNTESFWIKRLTLDKFFLSLIYIYTGYEDWFNFFKDKIFFLGSFLNITVFIFLIRFIKKNKKKDWEIFLYFWSMVGLFFPLLISFIKPIFLPRYFISFTVIFTLFLIGNLRDLNKKISLILVLIILSTNFYFNYWQIQKRKKLDLGKTIKEIKKIANKNDYLYVVDVLDFHTAQYYFGEEKVFIYNKSYEEIPSYVGKVLIERNNIAYQLPVYPRKAFVLYSDGHYEIKALF